ncbi:MAG TPA: hypothetical protein VFZ85_00015 [Jiangellaceae bacterium]
MMIELAWLGRTGSSKADGSRFAAMKVVATLCDLVGGPTVRRS